MGRETGMQMWYSDKPCIKNFSVVWFLLFQVILPKGLFSSYRIWLILQAVKELLKQALKVMKTHVVYWSECFPILL